MAPICTQCGTLFNVDDTHTCDPADIPAVGSPKKFTGTSGYSGMGGASGYSGAEGMSGYSGYSGGV